MAKTRVGCFVDGFNIYHAIHDLGKKHLKWLDYRGLAAEFINSAKEELTDVLYFSAYATWLPGPYARHRAFVAALRSRDVTVILSEFKEKETENV